MACAVIMLAGCRQATAPRDPIDRDAEAYIRIGLALAERDPDSLDSYVGPAAWQTDAQAHKQPLADVPGFGGAQRRVHAPGGDAQAL